MYISKPWARLLQNLILNLHLPINLDHKQDPHLKLVQKHSQKKASESQALSKSRTEDTKEKKMEKKNKKIMIKDRIHTVKERRPIPSRWSIGTSPLRTRS